MGTHLLSAGNAGDSHCNDHELSWFPEHTRTADGHADNQDLFTLPLAVTLLDILLISRLRTCL